MKKTTHILSAATIFFSLLMLCGCDKQAKETLSDTPVRAQIAVGLQDGLENQASGKVLSRANGDPTLTYTLEAWTRGDSPSCVLHQTTIGSFTEAVFDIALIPGSYDLLFWADYGKDYYNTSSLRQVLLTDVPYTPGEERDAFACVSTNVQWDGSAITGIVLKRPLAKLIIENSGNFTETNAVQVQYSGTPTCYDVLTGESSQPQDMTILFPETVVGSATVGEDFLFVPSDQQNISISITVGSVNKTLDDLQLKSNYRTRITSIFN